MSSPQQQVDATAQSTQPSAVGTGATNVFVDHDLSFFSEAASADAGAGTSLVLVVLNQPIAPTDATFQRLYARAETVVAADGGANRLAALTKRAAGSTSFAPDVIVGDLDSVRPAVLASFTAAGATVHKDEDPDCTDLDKCLRHVRSAHGAKAGAGELVVVCYGAFGGRLDQQLSCLNALYTAGAGADAGADAGTRVVLAGEGNIAELLWPGVHRITPPAPAPAPAPGPSRIYAGFLPFSPAVSAAAAPAQVATVGFQWNVGSQDAQDTLMAAAAGGGSAVTAADILALGGSAMGLGGLVSTSNRLRPVELRAGGAGLVLIATDAPLLWTMAVAAPEDEEEDEDASG